jgi:hypothetical protein
MPSSGMLRRVALVITGFRWNVALILWAHGLCLQSEILNTFYRGFPELFLCPSSDEEENSY